MVVLRTCRVSLCIVSPVWSRVVAASSVARHALGSSCRLVRVLCCGVGWSCLLYAFSFVTGRCWGRTPRSGRAASTGVLRGWSGLAGACLALRRGRAGGSRADERPLQPAPEPACRVKPSSSERLGMEWALESTSCCVSGMSAHDPRPSSPFVDGRMPPGLSYPACQPRGVSQFTGRVQRGGREV
jgi:hypothetical protein